ncbi:hypothetical protein [Escherichia phage L27]|nr:hypothetical protein [Escherichia phage L27]
MPKQGNSTDVDNPVLNDVRCKKLYNIGVLHAK